MEVLCDTVLRIGLWTAAARENEEAGRAEKQFCVGAVAQKHSEMKCGHCGITFALPR